VSEMSICVEVEGKGGYERECVQLRLRVKEE